jgi:DNA repair and recombination protein RAD54B
MLNSTLEPGFLLSVGGKEVEIDSILSKAAYLSGRSLLNGHQDKENLSRATRGDEPMRIRDSNVSSQPPRTKLEVQELREASKKILNIPAPRSLASQSAFKNPLKENTVLPSKPNREPVPRHDPSAPGAVIMKRITTVPKDKQIVDVVVDPILGKHLRPHQKEGVKFMYECVMGLRPFNGEGAILADEMGLGKTLQTITLLWTLLKQNPIYGAAPVIKRALIVCPVSLIENWQKEFRKWLGRDRLGVFVARGKTTRFSDFTTGRSYSVMIIGYEQLRNVHEELTKGSGVDIVIADEGHKMKTTGNKAAQAIRSLNTTRRIVLSGTPVQNNLKELFAAVDLVNPGALGTFKMFVKEFEVPIVKSKQPNALRKDIEKGEAREEELNSLTSMFMLHRTADILKNYLPPKTEYVLFCNPTSSQANIYRHVLASPVVRSALGNSENALQLITILKKLCNSPSLLSPKTGADEDPPSSTISALLSSLPPNLLRHFSPGSSGKIRVLDQLLHDLHSKTSEKIVLVSNYTSTLDVLAGLLTSLGLPFLRLDGSTPQAKRQALVEDFNHSSASSCFALLLSAKAGGLGLNLIGASRLVLFDVDWNPATDLQAMARIHRDGQTRHCRIYRLLLKGSLEEKIWQRQMTKIGLADSVMVQKKGAAQFSREELRDLFRLDEDSQCQTHDLMQCKCGGRGEIPNDGAASTVESDVPDEEDEDSDDLYESPPPLTKASELDQHPAKSEKTKAKKMRSLMEYSHFDPSVLCSSDVSASPDEESELDLALENSDEAVRLVMEAQIDDEVLISLLKEKGNGVGFLFKKAGFSGPNDNSAKTIE